MSKQGVLIDSESNSFGTDPEMASDGAIDKSQSFFEHLTQANKGFRATEDDSEEDQFDRASSQVFSHKHGTNEVNFEKFYR